MNDVDHLYEYAVVRYVPAVERDEFINIGLIMMCKRQKWLKLKIVLPLDKIRMYKSELPLDCLKQQLSSFERIVAADPLGGPVSELPVEERFRWITAVKSACLQTSRPHPGLSTDLDATFDCLLSEQVL